MHMSLSTCVRVYYHTTVSPGWLYLGFFSNWIFNLCQQEDEDEDYDTTNRQLRYKRLCPI